MAAEEQQHKNVARIEPAVDLSTQLKRADTCQGKPRGHMQHRRVRTCVGGAQRRRAQASTTEQACLEQQEEDCYTVGTGLVDADADAAAAVAVTAVVGCVACVVDAAAAAVVDDDVAGDSVVDAAATVLG